MNGAIVDKTFNNISIIKIFAKNLVFCINNNIKLLGGVEPAVLFARFMQLMPETLRNDESLNHLWALSPEEAQAIVDDLQL